MPGKFDLKKTPSGKFMFNLKAANNRVILTSELYDSKPAALNGIDSVKKNAANDSRYERKKSVKGESYFVLTATNGQTIGKSEMYSRSSGMENGIASEKKNGPDAQVADST